jgi:hypothetical protein
VFFGCHINFMRVLRFFKSSLNRRVFHCDEWQNIDLKLTFTIFLRNIYQSSIKLNNLTENDLAFRTLTTHWKSIIWTHLTLILPVWVIFGPFPSSDVVYNQLSVKRIFQLLRWTKDKPSFSYILQKLIQTMI